MKLKNFLIGFGVIAIILTLIPLFSGKYWWIRMFDYPHVQLTILTFTAFICYFIRFDIKKWSDYVFVVAICACLVFQFYKIYPYTAFAETQVKTIKSFEQNKNLKIFVSNALQTNKKKDLLLKEIKVYNPDLVMLLETDQDWYKATKHLQKEFKYTVIKPLPNTYGMILYSKKELIEPKVNFLVADSIPSIETRLKLNNQDTIQVYVIHPTPPMPQHNPKSTDRDKEMMMVGKMARESKLPTLVMGDFNDVAWSHTTLKFQRLSKLLDPRIGRGFYTTYNANSFLFRWPLDHVFMSKDFLVDDIGKGNNINSDHFPMYISIVLDKNNNRNNKVQELTEQAMERINKTLNEN
ncbi:endonuclease/exonuclease/phosphatase family protein [Mesonia ostreae]|uniref:Endonuclease/exonuclease/phosphatase family protein n=1 Tax=Mesonia ostreae TaxID=861110 RepID=A0ABU2KHZ3_9FLAO|nr:endonuclease/exonuclease/phosphatase family protein [Mesonia ostreae]MDT0294325.1 endonuclease/exonuclease/phosphatase family protein [Mesonia ostreae]